MSTVDLDEISRELKKLSQEVQIINTTSIPKRLDEVAHFIGRGIDAIRQSRQVLDDAEIEFLQAREILKSVSSQLVTKKP